ncbi:hypothetical protein [Xylella fastidiosa]|uniref:hypothetical protein n=1 Tax=Xylella fastidiosa TaxID=2371 RepID=UPI000214428A|nr:hypothetical protein [Xylella fastidiosa]EGO81106.1 hypothetical protein XFEB_02057 [Xylella fastidiosa EB92.1]
MSIFRILVFFVILFISRFSFACEIGEPHWDPGQCLDRGEAYAIASASYQMWRSNQLKDSNIPGLQVVDCPMTDDGHILVLGGIPLRPVIPLLIVVVIVWSIFSGFILRGKLVLRVLLNHFLV